MSAQGGAGNDGHGALHEDQPASLCIWRHPKPAGVAGRCVGRTDVPVDRRKAKRLAHRIRQHRRRAVRQAMPLDIGPPVIHTSPLQRSASVGRWLKAWGWRHHVDARLSELDFGTWDGRRWSDIGAAAMAHWCAGFAQHRAGGAESVGELLARCAAFVASGPQASLRYVVGHAGWVSAATWLAGGHPNPPTATDWPGAIGYGVLCRLGGSRVPGSPSPVGSEPSFFCMLMPVTE